MFGSPSPWQYLSTTSSCHASPTHFVHFLTGLLLLLFYLPVMETRDNRELTYFTVDDVFMLCIFVGFLLYIKVVNRNQILLCCVWLNSYDGWGDKEFWKYMTPMQPRPHFWGWKQYYKLVCVYYSSAIFSSYHLHADYEVDLKLFFFLNRFASITFFSLI